MELKKIYSSYNGQTPSTGKEVEDAFNENFETVGQGITQIEQGMEPFSVLDVAGIGIYTPVDAEYRQGWYYNHQGKLIQNTYWEYAVIEIGTGIYNFSELTDGNGYVAPLILIDQNGNTVKIFKNNISGINVRMSRNIRSIIVSRAIDGKGTVGTYSRYVDKNKLIDNTQKTDIFADADTNLFYRRTLLDLKISGINGTECLRLNTFVNKSGASSHINITDGDGAIICGFYNARSENGIKEVYLMEYEDSGYSGYAIINFDLLLDAELPEPLQPRLNNEAIKYDSIFRYVSNKLDKYPYASDGVLIGSLPPGLLEGLYLKTTVDGTPKPSGNIYFSQLIRRAASTQITINAGSVILCSFWIGSTLNGTQTVKLSEYQNSKIEGYARVNFDLMEIGVAYSNSACYLDKNRIFNTQIFYELLINSSLLNDISYSGLIGTKGKTLLAIGDSLTAAGEWQKQIKNVLGMNVITHAKGGASIITMIDGDSSGWAPLSVEEVSDVDYIAFYGGYNNRTAPYGQIGDTKESNTIMGMMQYAINRMYDLLDQANNLKCKIIIITPHCGGKYSWIDANGYEEWPKGSGRTLEGLAKTIIEIANYNSLPCIDLWHNSGINKFTWNVFQSSSIPNNDTYTLLGEFQTINDLPTGKLNDVAKILSIPSYDNTYVHNGTNWVRYTVYPGSPFPYNSDQLHLNVEGYSLIGEYIARYISAL